MSRITKPGAVKPRRDRPWEPAGAAWDALRRHLWARWRAAGTPCYHCACPFGQAPPDQIEHLISPQKRPDLSMLEENLRPTHGRCPACGLACNNIAAGNAAPRDTLGRSLPFGEAFKRQKIAEAAAKAARGVRARRDLPPSGRRKAAARPAADPGRDWLRRAEQSGVTRP